MFLAKIGNGLQLKVWSIGATPSAPCNNSLCKYTIRDSKIIKRGMNSFYMRLHKDFELIMNYGPASQKSHCIKTHNFHTKQSETIQPLCSTYLAKKFKFSRMNQWTFKQIFTIQSTFKDNQESFPCSLKVAKSQRLFSFGPIFNLMNEMFVLPKTCLVQSLM